MRPRGAAASPVTTTTPPSPPPVLWVLAAAGVLAAALAGSAGASPAAPDAAAEADAAAAAAASVTCDFESECAWHWNASERGFNVVSPLAAGDEGLPSEDASSRRDGHFLLLTGRAKETREWAIASPALAASAASADGQCRLAATLHMAHMAEGSVKAVVAVANNTRWQADDQPGNDHRKWEQHHFNLGRISQPFRVELVIATSGESPSHVAVDDLALVDCFPKPPANGCGSAGVRPFRCEDNATCISRDEVCDIHEDCVEGADEAATLCDALPQGASPHAPPPPARCSFEVDWCGWAPGRWDPDEHSSSISVSTKEFAWTLHRGSTTSKVTGPAYDHTFGNSSGAYLYLNMSQATMFADEAVVQSPVWAPPPPAVYNESSPFHGTCRLRFQQHHYGKHNTQLKLYLVELGGKPHHESALWRSYRVRANRWYTEVVTLPPIVNRYLFRFEARRGMGNLGDLALDDISLSPECLGRAMPPEELVGWRYGAAPQQHPPPPPPHPDFVNKTYYRLTSCGAKGRLGPRPEDCVRAYNGTSSRPVTVLTRDPFYGVQRWTAPEDNAYTILAKGASGGSAKGNATSLAAMTRLVLELHKGEALYVLVGQPGDSACGRHGGGGGAGGVGGPCASAPHLGARLTSLAGRLAAELHPTTGGAGGGGASFVFKLNDTWTGALPVLVAAGGGGLCAGCEADGRQHARGVIPTSAPAPTHAPATTPTPTSNASSAAGGTHEQDDEGVGGAGGGWRRGAGGEARTVSGRALLSGGSGGEACSRDGHGGGGFGGGGSGCRAGGGGGGYAGGRPGNATRLNPVMGGEVVWSARVGEGGASFVGSGLLGEVRAAAHLGAGEVVIVPATAGCRCDWKCAALDEARSATRCVCPEPWTLAADGVSCISTGESALPAFVVLAVSVFAIALLIMALAGMCFFLYNRYQRKKVSLPGRAAQQGPVDLQLNRIREATDTMMTQLNPNYDSGPCSAHDLRDIPRDQLRLVKALGQGAFGEVYQGFFRHRSGDAVEMPVAVKTLPELSTSQAETDFLMEALIMSKFSHPNIVHFIGVCFDKHPRFIVLELLAGGDLKTFLREARPKPERPSPLSMRDLLRCALDVSQGCHYMETNRFIHRDIAARNCLLTTKGPGRVVKIADFGMARDIYRADYYRKGGKAMLPIKWMPPEAFLDGIFTSKTDVWSFGVLLWEIMSLGFMPYTGCTNREVMQLVTSGGRLESPAHCPPPLYGVMTQCWHPAPDERPSFATIMERLGYCMQDPEVVNAPLPLFARAPSAERDATIMRPPASDTACLRVQRRDSSGTTVSTPVPSLGGTPGSAAAAAAAADYLVPVAAPSPQPASPPSTHPPPHLLQQPSQRLPASPSASSVDKLLDADGESAAGDWETSFVLPESRSSAPLLPPTDSSLSLPPPPPAPIASAAALAAALADAPSIDDDEDDDDDDLPPSPPPPARLNHNNNNVTCAAGAGTTLSAAGPLLPPPAAFKAPLALDAASLIKAPLSYVNVSVNGPTPDTESPASDSVPAAPAGARPFTVTEAAAASRRLLAAAAAADADISV